MKLKDLRNVNQIVIWGGYEVKGSIELKKLRKGGYWGSKKQQFASDFWRLDEEANAK